MVTPLGSVEILSILRRKWRNFESEQAQSNAFAAQTNETCFLQAPKGAAEKRSWNCNASVLLGTCGAEAQKSDICRPKDDKPQQNLRPDQSIIADLIPKGVRLLDVGCGQGVLLHHLLTHKQVDARGLEISQQGVNACVRKGLAVIQGDADEDLRDYPDNAFNWVVLSQTLQATKQPRAVLEQMARIGEHLVVSIPNFGYWRVRLQFLLRGRMPVNKHLSYQWYDTPNIHFCTIRDFKVLAEEVGLEILAANFLQAEENRAVGRKALLQKFWRRYCPNIFAEQAIFVLKKSEICVY